MSSTLTLKCRCGWSNAFGQEQLGMQIHCPECNRDFLITDDPGLFLNRNIGGAEFAFEDASLLEPEAGNVGAAPSGASATPPRGRSMLPRSPLDRSRAHLTHARSSGHLPSPRTPARVPPGSKGSVKHHGKATRRGAARGAAAESGSGSRSAARESSKLGLVLGIGAVVVLLGVIVFLFLNGIGAEVLRELDGRATAIAQYGLQGTVPSDSTNEARATALAFELKQLRSQHPGLRLIPGEKSFDSPNYTALFSLADDAGSASLRIEMVERMDDWVFRDYRLGEYQLKRKR